MLEKISIDKKNEVYMLVQAEPGIEQEISGYFTFFRSFLSSVCFGNLIASVFLLLVTFLEILLFFFSLRIKVIGPGQNFL